MNTPFFKLHTDKQTKHIELENSASGPLKSTCWLIGGGPSFDKETADIITATPAPRMCINLAGTGLIRPHYWTSYDSTDRFLSSIYLDPGIMKFVHHRRGMDLVPGTTYKVCESPNLFCFHRACQSDYQSFPSMNRPELVDWQDSMIQGIDILYRLGFRRIFLAGCEMRVRPNSGQLDYARSRGVNWDETGLLRDYYQQCRERGITEEELYDRGELQQYHFKEKKNSISAINTDYHYFRVSQYLRLSRKSMTSAGLELVSVTSGSRLNDYFPCMTAQEASELLYRENGNPFVEKTEGLYTGMQKRRLILNSIMHDFPPHQIKSKSKASSKPAKTKLKETLPVEIHLEHNPSKIKHSRFGQWCRGELKEQNPSE